MKCAAITNEGIEDICALEIKELLGTPSESFPSAVEFSCDDTDNVLTYLYKAQSIRKLIELWSSGTLAKIEDIQITGTESLPKDKTFAVKCVRNGTHNFTSTEVEQALGKTIASKGYTVDLKTPQIQVLCYIYNDRYYLGIDLSGFDLSKRQYNIFASPASIRSTIAYAMLRIAGFTGKESVVDPFTRSGPIIIEAALFASGLSTHYYTKTSFKNQYQNLQDLFDSTDQEENEVPELTGYDVQLKHILAARKNAKIAGVDRLVHFTKIDTEWLDTKHQKKSVDLVVTVPPHLSKHKNEKTIRKHYQDFFYALDYILKGKCVVACLHPEPIIEEAAKYKFKPKDQRTIHQGQEVYTILTFTK